MKKINIAIDGGAGTGKSTVSGLVAEKLGYTFVSSGLIYRAIAYYAISQNIDYLSETTMQDNLHNINIQTKIEGRSFAIILNKKDVTNLLHTQELSKATSDISKYIEVRNFVTAIVRDLAKDNNIIMEGRDIGTVILPDAEFKFFLTASSRVLAERRFKDLIKTDPFITVEEIEKGIIKRDKEDSEREHGRLVAASDAIKIDTGNYNIEEVVNIVIDTVKKDKE